MPKNHRRKSKLLAPRIKEPINVFISSHQQEFAKTRRAIKSRIERIRIKQFRKRLFVTDLVEDYPSTDLEATTEKLLSRSSMLVLLIGRRRSAKWVDYELNYARKHFIPILAYEYYRKTSKPPPIETTGLVTKLKATTTIHGYGDNKFEDVEALIRAIQRDVVEQVGMMVNGYSNVKKEVDTNYTKVKKEVNAGYARFKKSIRTG